MAMKALPLFSRQVRTAAGGPRGHIIGRVRTAYNEAPGEHDLLLVNPSKGSVVPEGFAAYLSRDGDGLLPAPGPTFVLGRELDYLGDEDVIVIEPERPAVRVLYRRRAALNSLLLTERCNHLCVMCSQPPKDRDDSYLVDELLEAIPLMSPESPELGFTGGEPTLLEDAFFELVRKTGTALPKTALHVLTNGRRFADAEFARALAGVRHPDLMLGIPLYADVADIHEYVVQASGAFDETIRGLLQLRRFRLRVELRFVIHRLTVERLVAFAAFVARNLVFVDQVALMGLELMGYARSNLETIWVDPWDYRGELREAVRVLEGAGIRTLVFNHSLCLVHEDVRHLAVKSISDWKNGYLPECTGCTRVEDCGGFFVSSNLRHSTHITPFGS